MRDSLIAAGLYALVALIVFYPVPFRLNSVLAGFSGRDGWEHAWWLWFAKRLMLEGRGLNDVYLLNHPVGLQHPYQWTLASFSLMAGLVGLILPPAATFNTMALGSFVLCGLAAYHLCRELTSDHLAATLGGVVFAFCPNRLGHALAGWLPQMTAFLYPWYALLLIRTLKEPSAWRAIGLGLLAAAGALVWPMHVAYFLLPLTLVIIGGELLRQRQSFFSTRRIGYLGSAFLVSMVLTLPFFMPLLSGRLQDDLGYLSTHGIVQHSTELLAFVTPSPFHPVLAPLGLIPDFARGVFDEVQTLRWDSAYIGVVPLLLGTWGLIGSERQRWRWFALFAGTALLSLGPVLMLAGDPIEYTTDGYSGRVLLPYAIIRQIPLLDWGRTPGRLNTTGMLGLGVLASFGLSRLLARIRAGRWAARALVVALVGVTVFEYLPIWPFPAGDATIPDAITYIAKQPGDGALLHIPLDRRSVNNRALYFQTATGKPIVGGTVLRTLPAVPPWQQTIEELVRDDRVHDAVPRPAKSRRQTWLNFLDVDWVILDRFFPVDGDRYRPFLEEVLGSPVVEDATLSAFAVPDDSPAPERPYLYTFSQHGWHSPEQDGETWRRWMYNDGELYVCSTIEETGSLHFNLDSHLDFPLLEVYREGEQLDAFLVGQRTSYATKPFTLTQGMNVFRFHAPGGCPEVLDDPRCWSDALLSPPEETYPPCDAQTTCRSFVFDHIAFVPKEAQGPEETGGVSFGDVLRLRGWDVETTALRPGDTLTATLTWEALGEPSSRHVVFTHLVSPGGELGAQDDDAPVGGLVPAGAWPEGATFKYPVSLELPQDLPAGNYRLLVGVYLWPSLERLEVPDRLDNAVDLGKVTVFP
mgnify:FL=1